MFVGQSISGTDIPADTRILTIVNGTSITIDKNATGTTADVTFTLGELAAVDDTDYPGNSTLNKTIQPGCVFLNGFLYLIKHLLKLQVDQKSLAVSPVSI